MRGEESPDTLRSKIGVMAVVKATEYKKYDKRYTIVIFYRTTLKPRESATENIPPFTYFSFLFYRISIIKKKNT